MKAVVAAFNQEKALVGAFSVITNLRICLGCNFLKHYYPLSPDGVQGDGGGPLLCPSPTSPATFTQAAITAWGIGCGGPSPGVYAALAEAVCWIDM